MSRCWTIAALFVSITSVACAADIATDSAGWPQWRGPDRTGISHDTGLLKDWQAKSPKLLWTTEGFGEGFSSVAIADGKLYTTGNFPDGQAVVCASAEDGKILWKQNITSELPDHRHEGARCTPSIDGDRLYAIASSGAIACLERATGKVVWRKDFQSEWNGKMMSGWGFSESPLVDGDLVLCTPGGSEAMIVALNKMTGETVWKSAIPSIGSRGKDGAGYSSIVVSNACGVKQYVQLIGRGLVGVRASDGKFLWGYNEIANPTANVPTPIISDDFIFCSTGYGDGGSALVQLVKDGDGIKAVEKYYHNAKTLQNHHGGMVMKDGYVYFGHKHGQGFPVCVEMESGKILWGGETRGPGNGSAGVTLADGNLIFRYESGDIALIEATPSGYHLKGAFKQDYVSKKKCWAHPVIVGGKLYLREQDKLMCYDVKE